MLKVSFSIDPSNIDQIPFLYAKGLKVENELTVDTTPLQVSVKGLIYTNSPGISRPVIDINKTLRANGANLTQIVSKRWAQNSWQGRVKRAYAAKNRSDR